MPDRCTCGRFVPVERADFASLAHCNREIDQTDNYICDLMTDARVKVLQEVAAQYCDAGEDAVITRLDAAKYMRKESAKIRRKARSRR